MTEKHKYIRWQFFVSADQRASSPCPPTRVLQPFGERRDELVDVGHCCSLDDLSSSRETASRSVPHMMSSRIVMSNSTGSCRTSAVDERSPHYSKVSECDRRGGERREEGEWEGEGEERRGECTNSWHSLTSCPPTVADPPWHSYPRSIEPSFHIESTSEDRLL